MSRDIFPPIKFPGAIKSLPNINMEFEIEGGVTNFYWTKTLCVKIHQSFTSREEAIDSLRNLRTKIELMLESMNIDLSSSTSKESETNDKSNSMITRNNKEISYDVSLDESDLPDVLKH